MAARCQVGICLWLDWPKRISHCLRVAVASLIKMQFRGCPEVLLRTASTEMYTAQKVCGLLDYLWYYIINVFGPHPVWWIKARQVYYNRHSFIFVTAESNLDACVKANVKFCKFEQNLNDGCLHFPCHPVCQMMYTFLMVDLKGRIVWYNSMSGVVIKRRCACERERWNS